MGDQQDQDQNGDAEDNDKLHVYPEVLADSDYLSLSRYLSF